MKLGIHDDLRADVERERQERMAYLARLYDIDRWLVAMFSFHSPVIVWPGSWRPPSNE